jgi:hypothetical protein
MIAIGKYNELTILRHTSVGLYLGDDEGEDVLLPNKYCPEEYTIGNKLTVFVYLDYLERKVATNLSPKINMHEFALLQVTAVANVGAFVDWGMEKNLMVPFKEQRQKMEEGKWYVVYLDLDEQTNRLYASNKIEKFLDNQELMVAEGDEVNLLVYKKTDIGYSVIVNHKHKGLVYHNQVFKELNIGDTLKGYIKAIRSDNKLDISIQPLGYTNFNSKNSDLIYNALLENNGFIPVTDKSAPDEIYSRFGISKKAFKKAVGDLYKQRKITIQTNGLQLV